MGEPNLLVSIAIFVILIILLLELVTYAARIFGNAYDYLTANNGYVATQETVTAIPHSNVIRNFTPECATVPTPTRRRLCTPVVYATDSSKSPRRTIIIAVDATPKRAGGLLVFPGQECVYFYSIEWKDLFNFGSNPDSDKFEMVNAMLALQLFEGFLILFRKFYDELILKGDNSIFTSPKSVYAKQRNAKWQRLFQEFYSKLQGHPFDGDCVAVTRSSDHYLRIADRLSRGDHGKAARVPEIVLQNGLTYSPFPEYAHTNISNKQIEIYPYMVELENSLQLGPLHQSNIQLSIDNNNSILVFTSALSSRCSGILVLSKIRMTYFYSLEWGKYLNLERESKETIQLLGSLVALHIFKSYVQSYRERYSTDGFLVTTNSDFCIRPDTAFSASENSKWRKLFCTVREILKSGPFLGNWDCEETPLTYKYKDVGMVLAGHLCDEHYTPTNSKLPKLVYRNTSTWSYEGAAPFFPENTEFNASRCIQPGRVFNIFGQILALSGAGAMERLMLGTFLDRLRELV